MVSVVDLSGEMKDVAFELLVPVFGVFAHLSEFAPKPIAFLVDARKIAADLFELVLETGDAGFEFGTAW